MWTMQGSHRHRVRCHLHMRLTSPLIVELADHLLQWDEAKWVGVLRVCVAQRGRPGAVIKPLCEEE